MRGIGAGARAWKGAVTLQALRSLYRQARMPGVAVALNNLKVVRVANRTAPLSTRQAAKPTQLGACLCKRLLKQRKRSVLT